MPIMTSEQLKEAIKSSVGGQKHPGGRPKKPKYDIEYMIKQIEKYTEIAEPPILKELCYMENWNYEYVNQLKNKHEKLSLSIKALLTKKEVLLEKALYAGQNNTGMIFGLKQLGWSDRVEQVVTADVNANISNLSYEEVKARIDEALKDRK